MGEMVLIIRKAGFGSDSVSPKLIGVGIGPFLGAKKTVMNSNFFESRANQFNANLYFSMSID